MLLPSKTDTEALMMRTMATYGQKIDKIEKTVTNELTHAIATRQQIGGIGDWFQANQGVIILAGAVVLLIWLVREPENSCPPCPPCEQGYTRSTSNGRSNSSSNSTLGVVRSYALKKGIDEVAKRMFKYK